MAEHTEADAGAARIAARLGYLFEHRHPEGRGPYTIAEVAAGTGISESSIKQLRGRDRANPTINTLTRISTFFNAPPTIWVVPDEELEEVLAKRDLTTAMQESGVQSIALRSQGLNAKNLSRITEMIDMARESQGLPPIPPT